MPVDVAAAEGFVWSCARLLDRHRYALLFRDGSGAAVVEALRGYRNDDGGFGHAMEPDLRSPESQTAATLYALEALEEADALDSAMARDAIAWIASVADEDGGLPFAVPGFEPYPHSPWWTPSPGSFLTFAVAALLLRNGVADPWLDRATEWCWRAIDAADAPSGYWLVHACAFLDAVEGDARARAALEQLGARAAPEVLAPPLDTSEEVLRPLHISPRPGSRSRVLFSDDAIAANLDFVEADQREDGGWMFDWLAWSPAQTTDWRGIVTIEALQTLRAHGRL
ncbi:MAG TPA: prenyltransferase/squalene oxidase repeat-containing protein [Solirubrobacteraceae bacterium]